MPIPPHIAAIRHRIGHELLIIPGVCGLVFNDAGEILLHRRSDTGRWAVIGGILDPGEPPADGVIREVREETAVTCIPERIVGVYTTPVITAASGDIVQYVITAFRCRYVSGTPRVNDDESLEVRFFPTDQLPDLRPDHRLRIAHALANGPAWFAPPRT